MTTFHSLCHRANALFVDEAFVDAFDLFSQASLLVLDDPPARAHVLVKRAACLAALDRPFDALQDCSDALLLVPGHEKALQRRGLLLKGLKEWEGALATFLLLPSSKKVDRWIQTCKDNI